MGSLLDIVEPRQESAIIKGIAHQILSLNQPSVADLKGLFSDFGLNILTDVELEQLNAEADAEYQKQEEEEQLVESVEVVETNNNVTNQFGHHI